jgi:surface antigen
MVLTAAVLATVAGPVWAQQGIERYFTKENVGRAVGAVTGALIGSQIGGGSGKLAAVAVGTLAGYWVGGEVGRRLSAGDQQGIAHTTQDALETGESQTWSNPDTGVYTKVSVKEASTGTVSSRLKPKLEEAPPVELVNEYYTADANINVRGGPGTDYVVLHRLARGERVPVVGRVLGTDWYMLAAAGEGAGYIYAPLVSRAEPQSGGQNAIREAMVRQDRPRPYAVDDQQCRIITQEVTLPDGTTRSHDFKACRQADGTWAEV